MNTTDTKGLSKSIKILVHFHSCLSLSSVFSFRPIMRAAAFLFLLQVNIAVEKYFMVLTITQRFD